MKYLKIVISCIILINIFLVNLCKCTCLKIDGELLNRVYVVRHGERTPDVTFPSYVYPKESKYYPGSLTDRGVKQMERLGKEIATAITPQAIIKIKSRDDCKNWICHSTQNSSGLEYTIKPSSLQIYASRVKRCAESAAIIAKQLNLTSGNGVNDSIVTIPSSMLLMSGSVKCNALVEYIIKEYLPKQRDFQDLTEQNRNIISYVFEKAGLQTTNLFPIYILSIANTLAADKLIGNALPDWVNETTYEKIQKIGAFFYTNLGMHDDLVLKYSSGLLFRQILNEFRFNIRGISNLKGPSCISMSQIDGFRKTYVYVGHDHTLVHLLMLLNHSIGHRPGFGASIVIDLWKPLFDTSTIDSELNNEPASNSSFMVNVAYKNYEGGLYKQVIKGFNLQLLEALLESKIPKDESEVRRYCDGSPADLNIEPSH